MDEPSAKAEKITSRWSWRKRLAFGAVTLLLFVVLVETVLQLARTAMRPDVAVDGRISDCDGIVFLAIGDSMTYGLGAPQGQSYPAQLPPFFSARYPGVAAKAYNLGIPGSNTSEGLLRLRKFIDEEAELSAPDYALVMYGVNNRWNLRKASFWEFDTKARDDNYLRYLVSQLQLNKVFSVTAQHGEAAADMKYRPILDRHGWGVFFKDYNDELLARWISYDLKVMASVLRGSGIEPVFLTYYQERFGGLNPLLRRIGAAVGVRVVDMERPTLYYRWRGLYATDNFHLNGKGYKDAARRAMEAFSRQVPRREIDKRLAAKKRGAVCSTGKGGNRR
ncbi:MAG: SGNH/GDSL hydrolase family protein [Deltaproteobacteria bacterium]|nr:SGNH/GDSL hydrolase family protein [Deltaproteobacteria bacterium]